MTSLEQDVPLNNLLNRTDCSLVWQQQLQETACIDMDAPKLTLEPISLAAQRTSFQNASTSVRHHMQCQCLEDCAS
jgi:hypothetical protein